MKRHNRTCFLIFFLLIETVNVIFPEGEETPTQDETPAQDEEIEETSKKNGRFGEYLKFEGYISFVSDYRWRGVSQTSLGPAVQGQGFLRTKYGFYTSLWGSYTNFPDVRNKPVHAEIDFIGGNSKMFGDFSYDIGYLYNYYPGAKGENYGEAFVNLGYKYFAAGMAYSNNVFDLNKSGFYVFGDLAPEIPITLPFCSKGVTLLLHVGHYTFGGSFNRSSYFDFKVGFAKTFLEHITLDLSFISTDGEFLVDLRDGGPTFVANLTINF